MQILALGPVDGLDELLTLVEALQQALPEQVELVTGDPAGVDPGRALLLPYLPPHRLLQRYGSSAEALTDVWSLYGLLVQQSSDDRRRVPSLPVNLERAAVPQLVGWLVQPDKPFVAELLPAAPQPDPLLALLTLHLLNEQPEVLTAYAALDTGTDSYREDLQGFCTPSQLLTAFAHLRDLEADLADQQQRLQQERLDLAHVVDDRDLLARQLNELHASFEAFDEQASSDAGKLEWNRKRRGELELTLKLQQKELELLARQVREQASLIQRSAAASEQMMQLLAGALAG